jgi:hypothetical protein
MAKSLFEPKRVPKYTENTIKPGTGLQSAPVPVRQQSANRPVPKTQAIPPAAQKVSAPAPLAPPMTPIKPLPSPPPAIGETRAFSFDGSTELVADYPGKGSSRFGTAKLTFSPGWGQEATGSFALYAIGTSGSNEYRVEVSILRSSGSGGYIDELAYKFISGSSYRETRKLLGTSPNTYSGSITRSFLQIHHNNGAFPGKVTQGRVYTSNRPNPANSPTYPQPLSFFTGSEHQISIGGFNSGSDHYFSGSIDQFVWFNGRNAVQPRSSAQQYDNDGFVKMYYKFEGNVTASKGNNLDVVGTETYVSSTI